MKDQEYKGFLVKQVILIFMKLINDTGLKWKKSKVLESRGLVVWNFYFWTNNITPLESSF